MIISIEIKKEDDLIENIGIELNEMCACCKERFISDNDEIAIHDLCDRCWKEINSN